MIITQKDLPPFNFKNKCLNKIINEAYFFDIETTGLSSRYHDIISITILLMENAIFKIYQIFSEGKIDDINILYNFQQLTKDKKYVITYNGNTFDINFIKAKATLTKIRCNFNSIIKIDLYNDMRHIRNKLTINDLKLKTVEKYFDIPRYDTMGGEDIITLYEAYSISKRKEFYELILQHNYEDVYNLPLLFDNMLNLYDKILVFKDLIIKITYRTICFKKNILNITFDIITSFKSDFICPSLNYDLIINVLSQTLTIKIDTKHYSGSGIVEFFYLNNNDYEIEGYETVEKIKKTLIPLKYNNKFYYSNITLVLEKIFNSLFEKSEECIS